MVFTKSRRSAPADQELDRASKVFLPAGHTALTAPIHTKSDVSDKTHVQNLVNRAPVVRTSIGYAAWFRSLCQIHRTRV